MGCTILVADVDPLLGVHITDALEVHGYEVMTAVNGPSALKIALDLSPDLIILDLMLPEMDGLEVCRQLRRARDTAMTPIIVIADRGDEIDTVVSLEVGADAFLTKPISHRELLAWIRALLRRARSSCTADSPPGGLTSHTLPSSNGQLVVGLLWIDLNGWSVRFRGKRVEMPKREFELLVYLARHPETALSRDQLLLDVWGKNYVGSKRTVDRHMVKLRQKFEGDSKAHRLIQKVFNVGYCFMPDGTAFGAIVGNGGIS